MRPERVGNIRIEDVLGQGGMGTVYVGFDETLERRVALKAIRSDRDMSPTVKARFLREAKVLSQVEHLNICRIHEFIQAPDGAEYLVLEYVEGHGLAEHIAGDSLKPAHRLKIALQIAEALVVAHEKGIVHRDLKPDNVRITPDGDAKILDFGLARVVDGADGIDDALEASARAEPEPDHVNVMTTEVGAIMGTPLFMSPEQAQPARPAEGSGRAERGDAVTTASDVYSFGLLLQHLWSGERTYSKGLSRRELMLRASIGEASWPKGLPSPIESLVRRCREVAPASRATAVEALERLRRFEQRPARILRRSVAAVLALVAIAATVKYTVDLKAQKDLADAAAVRERRQRELAELRRDGAEGLIGFALDDLTQKLSGEERKRELLSDLNAEVQKYYAAFSPDDLSVEELWRRVQFLYQQGETIADSASLPEAIAAFEQALALGQRIVAQEPGNEEVLVKLGYAHFWVGHGHVEEGDFEAAREAFEASADVARRLVEIDPDNPDYRLELAAEESNIAQILELQGELEASAEVMRSRLDTVKGLAASDPSRQDWQLELANSYVLLGRVVEAQSWQAKEAEDVVAEEALLDQAERLYRADIETMYALLSHDPGHVERLDRLGTSFSYLGNLLEDRGRLDDAAECYAEQQAISERLAAGDAGNASWIDHVAMSLLNVGVLREKNDEFDQAYASIGAASDMFHELVESDPTRIRWRTKAVLASSYSCRNLERRGEYEQSLAEARRATALATDEFFSEFSEKDVRTTLGLKLREGCLSAELGRQDAAVSAWRAAAEVIEAEVLERDHDEVRGMLIHALEHLGEDRAVEIQRASLRDPLGATGRCILPALNPAAKL